MILAVGIDSVDIIRFGYMAKTDHVRLKRLFSATEIEYCTSNPIKARERFAARFATKEAFYKALSTLIPTTKLPLFTVCRNVSVAALPNGAPTLDINWAYFRAVTHDSLPESIIAHLSLTHTTMTATAIVLLSSN